MRGAALHTIMMPLRDDGRGSVLFAHAAALARRFDAHVRVVHCRPRPEDMMPFGVVLPDVFRRQLEQASLQRADSEQSQLHATFVADAARHGISIEPRKPGTPTAAFREYEGKQVAAVSHFGRLADLICVARPDRDKDFGYNTLKSALFFSGRPVMVCCDTDQVRADIGRHVAIAWNGSLEASRAVALAMPLIEAAERITILTGGQIDHTATPEECRRYLGHRGITAEIATFERRGNVGRMLLRQSSEAGADLLIMGAYHDSYERESLLGGNSATVVAEATIPVVMVH